MSFISQQKKTFLKMPKTALNRTESKTGAFFVVLSSPLCINYVISSDAKDNVSFWCFCRVIRRLIESQLGRMAEGARSSYFRKKYGVRSRRRYYASRYAKSSTLFFAPGILDQLKAYWSSL